MKKRSAKSSDAEGDDDQDISRPPKKPKARGSKDKKSETSTSEDSDENEESDEDRLSTDDEKKDLLCKFRFSHTISVLLSGSNIAITEYPKP